MKTFLLSLLCLLSRIVFAQNKQSENDQLDLLRSPKSPAATIIGIAPSEIHTPTDPNDLMVHLKNSTDNFTKIPKSFAIDITPARIFGKKEAADDFKEGKKCFRDLVLSIAYRDSNDINLIKNLPRSPQIGFGFTIPLVKSKTNKFSEESIDNLVLLKQKYETAITEISTFNKNSTFLGSDNQGFISMNQYMTDLKTQIKTKVILSFVRLALIYREV